MRDGASVSSGWASVRAVRWATTDAPAAGALHRYADGHTIARQGDPVASVGSIVDGLVARSVVAPDGREAILAILGPGDLVGTEAFAGASADAATAATALGPVTLRVLTADAARALASSDPAFAREVAAALARQLDAITSWFADVAVLEVGGRLARRLDDLASRHGTPSVGGTALPAWCTQERLARTIASSRETVNRALRPMVDARSVRIRGRRIEVVDTRRRSGDGRMRA